MQFQPAAYRFQCRIRRIDGRSLMTELWPKLIRPAQRRFRKSRAELIVDLAPEIVGSSIIDVGGSLRFWRAVGHIIRPKSVRIFNISIDAINVDDHDDRDWITSETYDGKNLPVGDHDADFVICNSVIEHVDPEYRRDFARELVRVCKTYIVQTPSNAFPLEPHFGLPIVHWLPRRIARSIVRISPFNLFSYADAQDYFDHTQLLPKTELSQYFPGGKIITETFCGLPKSNIVMGRSFPPIN